MALNPKQLWLHTQNQLPDYIRSDPAYSNLVAFINAYYEWVQLTGQPVQVIADNASNLSIDDTTDNFIKYFANQYLDGFPLLYDVDETDPVVKAFRRQQIKRLIKHVNELYISKSTDDAFRMLFRVLYDEEIVIFYPKTVILKPSDGRWKEDITIKITIDSGDIDSFDLTYGSAVATESVDGTNTALTGARATIESILAVGIYHELHITPGSLVGSTKTYQFTSGNPYPFTPGHKVLLTMGDITVVGTILPVVSLITIVPRSTQVGVQAVGAILHPGSTSLLQDSTATLSVKSIDDDGKAKAISVVNSGYQVPSSYTNLYDAFDNLVGTCIIGGLTYYTGRYVSWEGVFPGFLSDQIKIRGPLSIKSLPNGHTLAEYYQEFSYVIKSPIPPRLWDATVRKLMHPIGYEVFGDMLFWPSATGGANLLGLFDFNTDDINDLDEYYDYLYHQLYILPYSTEFVVMVNSQATNVLGPTLQTLNRFMMTFPPYETGNTNYGANVPISSAGFGGATAVVAWDVDSLNSTQMKDYADLIVGDFFAGNAPLQKSNITAQLYMIVTP
jgi:hypothetical protein